ncbi:RHS repeat domain-containing protein [Urbifossiella limnaea]|uniref:Peptidase C-terminal archaeal/bacterial domain-containing protein n=1 Tax=Urbifossiella limnaea TaxID=2528023 RepID=A0A517Y258_9BACT|nr:hypothetical protein [Urbifossiella limnaea]QDU23851.1 hypothetical protein ETAA1_58590 [Urbifossiella limnaea]
MTAPRRALALTQLEDRTTPATLGAFSVVPQLGSLVYEASGTGFVGTTVAADGFESGDLGPAWSTYSSDAQGRVRVTGSSGTAAGAFALVMDRTPSGANTLNEAVWHVETPGVASPLLRFSHAQFNDEFTSIGTTPFTGHRNADGIAVSNDGVTWYPIWSPPGQAAEAWVEYTLDVAARVGLAGGTLDPASYFVKFQQFDNFPVPTDGRGWDSIAVVGPGAADTTTFTVDPGQTLTIQVDGGAILQPDIRLTTGGATVATATAPAPGGIAELHTVRVPGRLADGTPGPVTYTLEVGGVTGNLGAYSVRVVLNAALEAEGSGGTRNDTPAGAQSLDPVFLQLNRAGTADPSGRQPQRAAVLGRTDVSPSSGLVAEAEPNEPTDLPPLPTADTFAQDVDAAEWVDGIDPFEGVPAAQLTIDGTSDGTFDYYRFTLPADGLMTATIFSDFVDVSDGAYGAAAYVFDDTGAVVGFWDDFGSATWGSFPAGTYTAAVGTWYSDGYTLPGLLGGEAPPAGGTYQLVLFAEGHAVTAGGSGVAIEAEPNHPVAGPVDLAAVAQDLDTETWVINTDPFVPDATLPHVVIAGTGDGTFDYYRFTVPAGGGLVNFGFNPDGIAALGRIFLYDAAGRVVATADEFLQFGPFFGTLPGGVYYLGVGTFGAATDPGFGALYGLPPEAGDVYRMYVSVEGHAAELPTPDLYALRLKKGESVAAAVTELAGGAVQVEIVGPGGAVLAAGSPDPTNVGAAIPAFTAPANGIYYVRVTGTPDAGYNLVVTRNVTLDLERNSSIATAQPLTGGQVAGRRWVLGAIDPTVVLDLADSGWYTAEGYHDPSNTNYITGRYTSFSPLEYRSFFVADLSEVDGEVLAAQLRIQNPNYNSPDPSETFSLFDVNTPVGVLTAGGFGLTGVFDDLGTGSAYGSATVSAAGTPGLVTVDLNAAGRAALQASAGGLFAMGGGLTTLRPDSISEFAFGGSGNGTRQIEITTRTSDFYQITADARAMLEIETATPGGGAGAFGNTFDPIVRLYDAAGNLVASNDNGGGDGRNAVLRYKVPAGAGGAYYVEVTSSPLTAVPTRGEYMLSVKGDREEHRDHDRRGDDHSDKGDREEHRDHDRRGDDHHSREYVLSVTGDRAGPPPGLATAAAAPGHAAPAKSLPPGRASAVGLVARGFAAPPPLQRGWSAPAAPADPFADPLGLGVWVG